MARGGLSHLLDNFEDLRRPSSPSSLGPWFSSSSGWMDVAKMASHAIFQYNVLVIDIDNTTLGLI